MIKLSDLLREDHKETLHKGKSKSGLDWKSGKDNPKEDVAKLENASETGELTEMYENDPGVDDTPLKGYIMSLHKMASELYKIVDDNDEPEEWVMEKAKQCNHLLNAVHSHISYAKHKDRVAELDMEFPDEQQEGW